MKKVILVLSLCLAALFLFGCAEEMTDEEAPAADEEAPAAEEAPAEEPAEEPAAEEEAPAEEPKDNEN